MLVSKSVTIKRPPHNYSWALEMHVAGSDEPILHLDTGPDITKPFRDK